MNKFIRKLQIDLEAHCYLYHRCNMSIISDEWYDKQFKELQRLESLYPECIRPDSPTQTVGSTVSPSKTIINWLKQYRVYWNGRTFIKESIEYNQSMNNKYNGKWIQVRDRIKTKLQLLRRDFEDGD